MSTQIDVTNETTEQGRPFLKSGEYSVRVLNCEKKISKKNNPMLVFTYEIVSPDTVTSVDGKPLKITGLQTMDWIVFTSDNEGAKKRLKAIMGFAKLPTALDIDNPAELHPYKGKAFRVQLATEGGAAIDENTGQPLVADDGTPVTDNNYRIRKFLGADTAHTIPSENVAF